MFPGSAWEHTSSEAPPRGPVKGLPMSRTRYRFSGDRSPHFLTSTIVAWLPVFTRPEAVQVLLDSWTYLQKHQRLTLFGYVVLENHVHWIAASDDLSKEVGDFKSYTARRIVDLLESAGARTLLDLLGSSAAMAISTILCIGGIRVLATMRNSAV